MPRILKRNELAYGIVELVVDSPQIAKKAQPGHFVVAMADERGERIPLTIADSDQGEGTVTIVLAVVGTSSRKLSRLAEGDSLYAMIGPLGHASKIGSSTMAVMVAGGVGTAPIYPIAKKLHAAGVRVVSIQGARTAGLLFWTEKLAAVSQQHILVTDDGTAGRKCLVTDPLREILECHREPATCVYAIGPPVMMKACAEATRPLGVPTTVSLNTIMVDGTGMCGGCRVRVGGKTLFTCVDGPEFDGHLVDWSSLFSRQKIYVHEEQCSLDRYVAAAKC